LLTHRNDAVAKYLADAFIESLPGWWSTHFGWCSPQGSIKF